MKRVHARGESRALVRERARRYYCRHDHPLSPPGTRSIRVIWLCEELQIPYEVVTVDFSPTYRATPEMAAG
jgi:hypothetical protein